MSNYVFLIDQNKIPLNPVHPASARKLLDSGKAAVFRRYPFTLILKRVIENPNVYPLTLKIDPGSKVTGMALVTNQGNVIWAMVTTMPLPIQNDQICTDVSNNQVTVSLYPELVVVNGAP
jgi:hypothetical protein